MTKSKFIPLFQWPIFPSNQNFWRPDLHFS